ncbi:sensor histidine kinase [Cohnella nanjingensis]|uniref:Sensor histidine kinase n=2 Tax=Cohnella nanjingensis TaxID=1387779 RepID=A0A7X0RLI2_9BACL|nr:sensor histidine kinase [Cohnella nanjingensis]
MNLQTRLFASYILIILIPIIVFAIYIFNEFYKTTNQDILKANEYMLEMENKNMQNNIEMMERTGQLAVSDRNVTSYLYAGHEPDTEALIDFSTNVVPNLLRLQFNNPNIAHVRLYTSNANVKEIWPIFLDESRIAEEPWHREVLRQRGKEVWAFDSQDKDVMRRTLNPVSVPVGKISLLREIGYPNGSHLGLIQVDMLLENFFPKAFGQLQDDRSHVLLLDRSSSKLIYNKDVSFFGTVSLPALQGQFERHLDDPKGYFSFKDNGISYIGMFRKLDHLDVYLLNVVSLEESFGKINKTRNMLILLSMTLIAILSLLTFWANKFILKKFHLLRDSMKRVRKGDFQVQIDIRGGGEVGELAHHFKMMMGKINGLIADAVNKQAATKEAELKALKNQINSHFLYNTLENLKMMAEVEAQYKIADSLTSLGGMMRYNLHWSGNFVRFKDEINHIKNYIAIMNVRYEDRIRLACLIPPEFHEQDILKMSLQPIVENAVIHGLTSSGLAQASGLLITIEAYANDRTTVIELKDNGPGMAPELVRSINEKIRLDPAAADKGIGLRNVNQRIQMHYGIEYGIQLESVPGEYTKVVMRLPKLIWTGGQGEHAQAFDH